MAPQRHERYQFSMVQCARYTRCSTCPACEAAASRLQYVSMSMCMRMCMCLCKPCMARLQTAIGSLTALCSCAQQLARAAGSRSAPATFTTALATVSRFTADTTTAGVPVPDGGAFPAGRPQCCNSAAAAGRAVAGQRQHGAVCAAQGRHEPHHPALRCFPQRLLAADDDQRCETFTTIRSATHASKLGHATASGVTQIPVKRQVASSLPVTCTPACC